MELVWLLSPPQAGVSCPKGDLGQARGLGQRVCLGHWVGVGWGKGGFEDEHMYVETKKNCVLLLH